MLVIYRVITVIICDLLNLISISCLYLLMRLILEALILRQVIIHRVVTTAVIVSSYLHFLLWVHPCAINNLIVASHWCCFIFCCSHHDYVAHRFVLLTTDDQVYHLL
jgi:hypothetical protein